MDPFFLHIILQLFNYVTRPLRYHHNFFWSTESTESDIWPSKESKVPKILHYHVVWERKTRSSWLPISSRIWIPVAPYLAPYEPPKPSSSYCCSKNRIFWGMVPSMVPQHFTGLFQENTTDDGSRGSPMTQETTIYIYIHIWGFPEIGVPPVLIHF